MGEAAANTWPKSCAHCGDDCPAFPFYSGDQAFCCQGCRTAYRILTENGLESFYQSPSENRQKVKGTGEKRFDFLDQKGIRDQVLDFSDGNHARVNFFIPAIHCSSCIWVLEHLYRILPGIENATVDIKGRRLDLIFREDRATLSQIVETLHLIGYPPDLSSRGKENEKPNDRSLMGKLGVAGFCFGNIMLLSFPEYLGASGPKAEPFLTVTGYLSLLLSLPVLLYAASAYYLPAIKGLRGGYVNIDVPVTLGIIALFGRSAWEIVTTSGPGYLDSMSGLVFFLLIGKWFQNKTYHAIQFDRDEKSFFPLSVTRENADGQEDSIPLADIRKGDQLLVRNGELIPCDGTVLEEAGTVDNSFITGESEGQVRQAGDPVKSGGKVVGRAIRLQVERPPDQSYLNRLWNTQVSEQENESRSRSLIDGVSQYFTLVVLLLATGTALFWQSTAPALTWTSFSAVLIVACPCALALTVPFTLGNTLRILGRHRFYGKNTDALEKLGKVTDIVFDKTGTLTVSGGRSVRYEGETLSEKDKERIWNLARQSAHPLSRHIASHLFRSTFKKYNPTDYEEEPGQGISAEIDGERIFLGTARKVGKSKDPEEPNALVHVRTGDRIRGKFTFSQELRTGTKELLEELGERYRLHLLTGDQGSLPEELKGYFDADKVRTGMVPHQKKQYIEALETEGKRVLMVGDGVNDAAALRTASTGLAVSADVHTFSPASDGILEGNVLKKLGKFLSASRRSLTVIRVGFAIALTYNVAGLSYAVTANLTPMIAAILMPLSSITVVLFATLASRKIACRDITA